MRRKSSLTIVEQAIVLVPEFEKSVRRLETQVTLRGQSKSTLNNYIRRIALFVVRFGQLPEHVAEEEINEYLVALARDPKSPSRSSFKHMVYGLRGQEVINLKISDIDFQRQTIHIMSPDKTPQSSGQAL
jgi:integrase/recombinase XerD